jgi:hypothetical protein
MHPAPRRCSSVTSLPATGPGSLARPPAARRHRESDPGPGGLGMPSGQRRQLAEAGQVLEGPLPVPIGVQRPEHKWRRPAVPGTPAIRDPANGPGRRTPLPFRCRPPGR